MELLELMDYLKILNTYSDVRDCNKKYLKLSKFKQFEDSKMLI